MNVEFPEVVTVKPNTFHKMHTTRSWDFIGLEHNHQPHQSGLLKKAKYGEDVIVGVIDSGMALCRHGGRANVRLARSSMPQVATKRSSVRGGMAQASVMCR